MTEIPDKLIDHVIVTGRDGELVTEPERVDAMAAAMVKRGKGVLHFHGGLVSERGGLQAAEGLLPVYEAAQAYPVFFIWRSDVLSQLRGNLEEIAREEVFKRLLAKVLAYAAGKVKRDDATGRAVAGASPETPGKVARELKRRDAEEEPFDRLPVADEVSELTTDEELAFTASIEQDAELTAHVDAAVRAADPDAEPVLARGLVVRVQASRRSLMDPDALAELQGQPRGAIARGSPFEMVALLRKAAKVLRAVIRRHRDGRWHGLYATVVEELLREFYLANAGAVIWATMKRETRDTFQHGDKPRGGERFLVALTRELPSAGGPSITLVGHSTGAVFINNLIGAVDEARATGGGLPADFRFRNIIFLAPACTFADFAQVATEHERLWERFRMFTMTDKSERADRVFSFVYPHSLLYLVSGLCERDAEGRSEGAKPLVGLERWWKGPQTEPAELVTVRELLRHDRDAVSWSPNATTSAIRHGDFDNDKLVRQSLTRLIKEQ